MSPKVNRVEKKSLETFSTREFGDQDRYFNKTATNIKLPDTSQLAIDFPTSLCRSRERDSSIYKSLIDKGLTVDQLKRIVKGNE